MGRIARTVAGLLLSVALAATAGRALAAPERAPAEARRAAARAPRLTLDALERIAARGLPADGLLGCRIAALVIKRQLRTRDVDAGDRGDTDPGDRAPMAHRACKPKSDISTTAAAYLEAQHPRLLKASLAYWMEYEAKMQVGGHHIEWSELIWRHRKLALLAARGHGKSGFWSFAYPLWKSWRAPNTTGLLISNTESQVADLMRLMKQGKRFELEDGTEFTMNRAADIPCIAAIMPDDWERSWTTERLTFTNGSEFKAKTFGKSFRGTHVHWIVVDDPIKDNAQYSETERNKAKDFLHRTIAKMLLPAKGSQLVNVGTPMHGEDLHADLKRLSRVADKRGRKHDDWFQADYPGHWKGADGVSHYLWPEFRDAAWHQSERESNELAYAQEIELKPVTGLLSIFPPDLFHRHATTMDASLTIRPSLQDIAANGWAVYMGVDLAISAEVKADYTVIVVMAVDGNNARHVIDLIRLHGASYNEQIATIRDTATLYEPELIVIERNQMQVVFADEVERVSRYPVRAYHTGVEKNDLRKGVPSLRPLIENGRLHFPRGDVESIELSDVIIGEMQEFGFKDGKVTGLGKHDDCVMALWLCDQGVRTSASWGYADYEEDPDAPAAPAVPEDADVDDLLEHLAVTSVREGYEQLGVAPAARINPAAIRWQKSAILHPEGLAGICEAAAHLPDDRQAWALAWNALSPQAPNMEAAGQAFCELYFDVGREVCLAMIRDRLGW